MTTLLLLAAFTSLGAAVAPPAAPTAALPVQHAALWRGNCLPIRMVVDLRVDDRVLGRLDFKPCLSPGPAAGGRSKEAHMTFVAPREIAWPGQMGRHPKTTPAGETITLRFWQVGAIEQGLLVGVVAKTKRDALANASTVLPMDRRDAVLAPGVVVSYRPEPEAAPD